MNKTDFRADLLALRGKSITFDVFVERNGARFRKLAAHYFTRWPQTSLDLEDLAQEGLIAAWYAVDAWDPEKTADVVRFVEYQVGRKIRVELERVLGWPDKRRDKPAIRPISIDSAPGGGSLIERPIDPVVEARDAITAAARGASDDLGADVIHAIGIGMHTTTAARVIYDDTARRTRYGLSSYEDTIRAVRRSVRRETKRLSSPPGKTRAQARRSA